jgi:hypothetical protein
MSLPPHLGQGAMSLAPGFKISARGLACFLLERMKHVHGFLEGCNVENPMRSLNLDSNLADAGANIRHRFPISRIESLLNAAELKAC